MRKSFFILLAAFMLAIASLPVSVAQAWCGCHYAYERALGCGDDPCTDDFHRAWQTVINHYKWYEDEACTKDEYCSTTYRDPYCVQDLTCGGVNDEGGCTEPVETVTTVVPTGTFLFHFQTPPGEGERPTDAEIGAIVRVLRMATTAEEAKRLLGQDPTLPSWASDIEVSYPPE